MDEYTRIGISQIGHHQNRFKKYQCSNRNNIPHTCQAQNRESRVNRAHSPGVSVTFQPLYWKQRNKGPLTKLGAFPMIP
jgi:hypothetical protein